MLEGHLTVRRFSHNMPHDAVLSSIPDVKPVEPPSGAISSLRAIWQGISREHAAFAMICIYLIFEYNRPHLIYPALDVIPWGKILLILALALAYLDKTSKLPSITALLPLNVFCVCVLLSMVFAFSPSVAANEWTMFFSWYFAILIIVSVVNTRQRLFLFVAVYFLANFKMAQHGFRSWAMGGFGFSGWGVSGSPGWFQNSGEFSLEMVVFLPLVLAYIAVFRSEWSRWVKAFFYLLMIMSLGSIIASSSRGGILGLIAVGLWGLAYSRHRIKALIILALLAVIVYKVMPTEFKARFETAGEDKTSLSRLAYWETGKEAIRDNSITGVGFRNWTIWVKFNHPELVMKVGEIDRIEVIHNTYLEAATELGVPGFVAYCAILMQIFFTNLRSARLARVQNDRFLEATAVGVNGSLIGYLAPSYFMAVLYYPYVWILLTLTVSVSSICRQRFAEHPAYALSPDMVS